MNHFLLVRISARTAGICPIPRPHDVAHHDAGDCRHAAWKRKRISQVVGSLSSLCFKASSRAPNRIIFCLPLKGDYPCFGLALLPGGGKATDPFEDCQVVPTTRFPTTTRCHRSAFCHNGLLPPFPSVWKHGSAGIVPTALLPSHTRKARRISGFSTALPGHNFRRAFLPWHPLPPRHTIPPTFSLPTDLTRRILCTCIA